MESEAVKRWLEKRKKKTEPDDDFLIVLKSFIFLWSESSPAPLSRNRINTPGGTPQTVLWMGSSRDAAVREAESAGARAVVLDDGSYIAV